MVQVGAAPGNEYDAREIGDNREVLATESTARTLCRHYPLGLGLRVRFGKRVTS